MAKSNLAVLMSMYTVTPQMLSEAVGADITLISRWRTGRRRLVAGRRWVHDIAAWFIRVDEQEGQGRLAALLRIFYPAEDFAPPAAYQAATEKWLSVRLQTEDEYAERRDRQISPLLRPGEAAQAFTKAVEPVAPLVVYGEKDTRAAILDMLDKALDLPEADSIRFVCPEGLALITQNANFSAKVMGKMNLLFQRGFRLEAILTADYKMSEVSAFSGMWLSAHLKGYVRSFYSNDFYSDHSIRMLAVFGDKIAARVVYDEMTGLRGEFYYNSPAIKGLLKEQEAYCNGAGMRFHYDFFRNPEDYLSKGFAEITGDCYVITRLPHVGIRGDHLVDRLNLSAAEADRFRGQFGALLTGPADLGDGASFYHILCPEDIERALDKPRHRIMPSSDIFGRRVYMSTQALVEQLVLMRRLLKNQSNYNLCFLPESFFEGVGLELAIYGKQAAIGWIAGECSTACKDPTHVAILQGYASLQWNRIPGMAKTKGAALKRLNAWLRRAKNFGYEVED